MVPLKRKRKANQGEGEGEREKKRKKSSNKIKKLIILCKLKTSLLFNKIKIFLQNAPTRIRTCDLEIH